MDEKKLIHARRHVSQTQFIAYGFFCIIITGTLLLMLPFASRDGQSEPFFIAILTAITIVLGMRMMGAMLISSLIIFPALTSMRLFKSFRVVVLSSGVLGVVCFCIGMVMSYRFSTPAGASVVVVNLAPTLPL